MNVKAPFSMDSEKTRIKTFRDNKDCFLFPSLQKRLFPEQRNPMDDFLGRVVEMHHAIEFFYRPQLLFREG